MLEIVTHGFFVGAPHEVGASGALIYHEGHEVGRLQRIHAPDGGKRGLDAELAVLADALHRALERGGGGDSVVVRTGQASLATACRSGPHAATLAALAREFEQLRCVVSPGWVTARAQDLALRLMLSRGGAR